MHNIKVLKQNIKNLENTMELRGVSGLKLVAAIARPAESGFDASVWGNNSSLV